MCPGGRLAAYGALRGNATELLAEGGVFDVSQVQDVIRGGVSLTVNELSPQANLYPGIVTMRRTAPAESSESYEPTYWSVSGTVKGSAGSVMVTVLTLEDEVVSTAELTHPGEFSFTISLDHEAVKVEASRRGHRPVTSTCFQGCQPVLLELP